MAEAEKQAEPAVKPWTSYSIIWRWKSSGPDGEWRAAVTEYDPAEHSHPFQYQYRHDAQKHVDDWVGDGSQIEAKVVPATLIFNLEQLPGAEDPNAKKIIIEVPCGTDDYWCHGTCQRHGVCMYTAPGGGPVMLRVSVPEDAL